MTTKKSKAMKVLDTLTGGPLTLGVLLRSIRLGEEMSMAEFGSLLRVSRGHINELEKGHKGVTPRRAAQFAKKLGYLEAQFIQLAIEDQLRRDGLKYRVQLKAA